MDTASETVVKKAHRYLTTGRLDVVQVDDDTITATCRADSGDWLLGWTHPDGWWCGCPASTRRCAHLVALRLVTIRIVGAVPAGVSGGQRRAHALAGRR